MDLDGKQVRIALLGSPCCGKTCIVRRFIMNTFHGSTYIPTQGIDFHSRRIGLKPMGTVTFIILDLGASTINSKMLRIYLHGIDLFFLTYDMTNLASINELRQWIDILTVGGVARTDASLALIGSKGDLEHLRSVRLDAHTRFAQEYNIPLSFLVSAKSGESVMTCFTKSAIYHLSPDAKQKIREHTIVQNTFSMKRSSLSLQPGVAIATLPLTRLPPAGGSPAPKSAASANQSATKALLDPSSVVCVVQ